MERRCENVSIAEEKWSEVSIASELKNERRKRKEK